jgi:hypothetical protein
MRSPCCLRVSPVTKLFALKTEDLLNSNFVTRSMNDDLCRRGCSPVTKFSALKIMGLLTRNFVASPMNDDVCRRGCSALRSRRNNQVMLRDNLGAPKDAALHSMAAQIVRNLAGHSPQCAQNRLPMIGIEHALLG